MAPLFTGLKLGFGRSAAVASTPTKASGGDVNYLQPGNGYIYHTFTTTGSGTFVVNEGPLTCEILVVAGGGAGGSVDGGGGGGGAGGVASCSSLALANGTYPLVVGAGQIVAESVGGTGTPSVFYSPAPTTGGRITALGGGKGAYGPRSGNPVGKNGTPGGSGGGGQGFQTSPVGSGGASTQPGQSNPPNTTNYGNAGAPGNPPSPPWFGAGGSAGGAGGAATSDLNGGIGVEFPQFAPPLAFTPSHPYISNPRWETTGYYGGGGAISSTPAAGGGGANSPGLTFGVDGLGGGGSHVPIGTPTPTKLNQGGHGIIIIRYAV